MGLRVLIVENCPKHQQSQASAWATYLTSCGNILGYICGFSTLPQVLHLPQITQFQSLCMIASVSLTLTVMISCYFITENGPRLTQPDRANSLVSILSLRQVIRTANMMPIKVRKICQIQFFAWMAWFPFLYYSATYVGELYIAPILAQDPTMAARQQALLRKESAHIGTLASLLFAIVAFLSNIVLSSLIQQSKPGTARVTRRSPVSGDSEFSIARAWMCAHLWFATSMFATVFITSWAGGAVLVAYVGISWAMTLWAPFSIIGEEMVAVNRAQDGDDQMGVIMSLHNVAISAPQVVSAIASSGLFWIAKVLEYQDSTGLVLRVGAFAALAAAYLTWKLED
jgi:solute carrier family 45, member 1/2/4